MTLGGYRAVEVESETGRKMQASSDYEPSRVLMLLEALLYPIPRDLSSPSLGEGHPKWKIENGAVGGLSYERISRTSGPQDVVHAYLFLLTGVLVQSIEVGIVTSWEDQITFGGKLVPRHVGVQGGTRDLLTAHVAVLGRRIIRHILDRHGVTREVEVLDSPNPAAVESFLRLIRADRFHPAKIDYSPC